MNKKGFTLVELLAVIVIIGLLVSIAVPSVIAISNKIRKNMFCTKIEIIEKAAELCGEDNSKLFNTTCTVDGKTYSCLSGVTIGTLLTEGYITADTGRCTGGSSNGNELNSQACTNSGGVWGNGNVLDPRDKTSVMNNIPIIVYKKNNRVYSRIEKDENNINISSTCD